MPLSRREFLGAAALSVTRGLTALGSPSLTSSGSPASDAKPRRLVMIAGTPSHPPERPAY